MTLLYSIQLSCPSLLFFWTSFRNGRSNDRGDSDAFPNFSHWKISKELNFERQMPWIYPPPHHGCTCHQMMGLTWGFP